MMLFLSSAALAQAHPGHPGHEDDPYRMTGLVVPFPELGYFLPLLALGACLVLLRRGQRAVLAGATAFLLGVTVFTHSADPSALTGLLTSAACALGAGAVTARAFLAIRHAASVRNSQ